MANWDHVHRQDRARRAGRPAVDRGFERMTIVQRSDIRRLARERNIDVGDLAGYDRVMAGELIDWLKRQ